MITYWVGQLLLHDHCRHFKLFEAILQDILLLCSQRLHVNRPQWVTKVSASRSVGERRQIGFGTAERFNILKS